MNPSAPPTLYLIRHGETEWSRSGKHTSRTEVKLTEKGEDDARALKRILQSKVFTEIRVSPRARARLTCELAGIGGSPVVDSLLQEWDYGDFEGLTTQEIETRRPGWNLFRDGCPGGEQPDDVGRRADAMLEQLRTLQGNVALISHGHFLRVLGARWVRCPVELGQRLYLATASLSVLSFEHGNPDEPVILSWNGTQDSSAPV